MQAVVTHLAALEREGLITIWHQGLLGPGDLSGPETKAMLEASELVLLLLSPDYIASDRCMAEAEAALELEARVVPVVLRPCGWEETKLGGLGPLPRGGRAVSSWEDRDGVLVEVGRGVLRIVGGEGGDGPVAVAVPWQSRHKRRLSKVWGGYEKPLFSIGIAALVLVVAGGVAYLRTDSEPQVDARLEVRQPLRTDSEPQVGARLEVRHPIPSEDGKEEETVPGPEISEVLPAPMTAREVAGSVFQEPTTKITLTGGRANETLIVSVESREKIVTFDAEGVAELSFVFSREGSFETRFTFENGSSIVRDLVVRDGEEVHIDFLLEGQRSNRVDRKQDDAQALATQINDEFAGPKLSEDAILVQAKVPPKEHGQGHREALRRIEDARAEGATELNLMGLELEELPPELWELTSLTQLYLGNNELTTLPESIGNLEALNYLTLNRNVLTKLPESITKLGVLTILDLEYNVLTELPESIGDLEALNYLNLNFNGLTTLPESITKLRVLTELSLGDNRLTALPVSIGDLEALTHLDLDNNNLQSLPQGIRNLTQLEELYLHGNEALGIPDEVLGWTRAAQTTPAEILAYYFDNVHPTPPPP